MQKKRGLLVPVSHRLSVQIGLMAYSFLAVAGLQYYLTPSEMGPNFAFLLFMPLLYTLLRSSIDKLSVRTVVITVVLSFLYASCLVLGIQCENSGQLNWSKSTVIEIVLLTLFVESVVVFLFCKLTDMILAKKEIDWTPRKRVVLYGAILLPQLFVLFITFPGIYGYDGGFHILQIIDSETGITSKYSVLYTLLFGGLVKFGLDVFASAAIGFALCMFVQCVALSFVAYRVTIFVYELTNSILPVLVSVAFFGFFPLYLILTVSSSQDVLFGAFFLLFFLELVKFFQRGNVFVSLTHIVVFVSAALLMSLFRNNGVYVLLFVFAVALIVTRGMGRRKIVLALAVPVVLCFIVTGPLYSLCGISAGSPIREMMSIPSQQIARVYTENPAGLTESDKKLIDQYYGDGLGYYSANPSISDASKGALKEDEVRKNPVGYIQLYVSLGIREPGNYAEAFLMNTLGFWYPNKVYPDTRMYHPFIEYEMLDAHKWNEKYIEIERVSFFPTLDRGISFFIGDARYQNLPIVSLLFTNATYFFFFLFVVAYAVYRKEKTLVVPFSLILGLYLTYLLSPVCLFRYCYAFIICFPILFALLIFMIRRNSIILSQDF